MNKPCINVAVTGPAGHIGYALIFRIASGAMFGPDQPVRLQLIELEPALPVLNGVRMELEDCAFPLLQDVICTADLNQGMRDANWALLVGSVPRKAGMERSDLLKINGGIFSVQGKAINENAAKDVRVFVVGNPCNTNALIAKHHAPNVSHFYAMTMLDHLRAKSQLAIKAGVPVSKVSNMTIWGNHSATQYPDFYNAKIDGKPVTSVISDEKWLQNDFITTVQQRGAKVIEARGSSSAASAANAIVEGVRSIAFPTSPNDHYSMAVCSQGQYGVDEGLIFSFPCRTTSEGVQVVEGLQHNEFGKEKFLKTLQELRAERDAVKELISAS